MAISRIARIHLVYQFIILTLVVFAIYYNEILPDKKFLFLALIPLFCYQLVILFFCTELLPLPVWFRWSEDAQTEVGIIQEDKDSEIAVSGSAEGLSTECSKSPEEAIVSELNIPKTLFSPNLKESPVTTLSSDANTQTTNQSTSEVFKKGPIFKKAGARRSESTKSYYFPYREKRLEDCLETDDNSRTYKVRNWRSLHDHKGVKSQSDLKVQSEHIENDSKTITTSPPKLETLEESTDNDSNDLTKSYSFPFRQRRLGRWMESEDKLVNDLNIPVMPAWNAIDYFSPTQTNRRRKSVSTEAIDRELRLINSHFEQTGKNDFTQSMEVTKEPILVPEIHKKGLKSSASFNKWKQGITNYFNKPKKENNKDHDSKQNYENKNKLFKELFFSKEVLFQEQEKREVSNSKSDNSFFPKSGKRVKLSNVSPSYISYKSNSCEEDEKSSVFYKDFECI